MEDYVNRMRSFNNESMEEYCKKYPAQDKCKEYFASLINREEIMTKIATALKDAQK